MQKQRSYIEVIADDVNLHVSPSEEAEVIDTVNSGTRLPLLETVSAEDGITWYKVSWNEADLYAGMGQRIPDSRRAGGYRTDPGVRI